MQVDSENNNATTEGPKRKRRRGRRGSGSVYKRKGSRFWWIRYSVAGKRVSESSGTEDWAEASALLAHRLSQARKGTGVVAPERITVARACNDYIANAKLRGLRAVDVLRRAVTLVCEHIGSLAAQEVTTGTLQHLQRRLTTSGYAPATVNRIVTMTHAVLKLAAQQGYLTAVPLAPKGLVKPKPRQGFVEHADFLAITHELPEWAADVFEFFYRTGWRRKEVLWLTWDEVDLENRAIRLDPDRDKTRESRVWPLTHFLDDLIARRLRARIVGLPYVFHRHGEKIGLTGWRGVLTRACKASGRQIYTHDCRRTAARNLDRAGVPRAVAMKLIGHRTESMYRRYRIVNEEDLSDGVSQLDNYFRYQEAAAQQRLIAFGREGPNQIQKVLDKAKAIS